MSEDTPKVKITNIFKGTWWWWMGFLFTVGYLGLIPTGAFWKDLFGTMLAYIFWPLLLGLSLGGNV